MAKDAYITFRVPAEMHAALQDAAGINCRNLSAECRAALRAHLGAQVAALHDERPGDDPGAVETTHGVRAPKSAAAA